MRTSVSLALATAAGESPDLTRVPPSESIVDSFGNVWKLRDIGNGNKLVERNGGGPLWQAHAIKYVERVVWFWDSGGWHRIIEPGTKVGDGQASEPPPIIVPPPPPPPENRAPVWTSQLIEFEQGKASSVRLTDFARDPDGDPLTFAVLQGLDPSLSDAFSFDQATMTLSYNGKDFGLRPAQPDASPSFPGDPPFEVADIGVRIEADDGR